MTQRAGLQQASLAVQAFLELRRRVIGREEQGMDDAQALKSAWRGWEEHSIAML